MQRQAILERPAKLEALLSSGYMAWIRAIVSVLGARVMASACAFVGNVLVARHLEPWDYGRFYLLFAVMSIVAGLTGPAIDTSLIRFASQRISPGRDDSGPYFKGVLYFKMLILAFTMITSVLVAKPMIVLLFPGSLGRNLPYYAIVLAFSGGAVVSMWGFAQSYFVAHQKFTHYAGYEFCSSILRLGLSMILISFDVREVLAYVGVYVGAPLVMALMSWSQLPRSVFTAPVNASVGWELWAFAKWALIATVFTTISQRLDLLLLNFDIYGISREAIGIYSAGVSFVLAGELVLLTFYNVLLPKASQLKSAAELRYFISKFRIPSLVFCLGLTVLIPLSERLCFLLFGEEYFGTHVYFNILLTGVIVTLACAPSITALYALGHTGTVAIFEGLRLVLTLIAGVLVVADYGEWGMAWVTALVRGGTSVAAYLYAHQVVRRMSIREAAERAQPDFF
ncbi:MAG: hypothetical protein HYV27_01010 [Candidatus Hydrogenedentes bacterium]|nr:hypothetical protein [Candidatus Hydrogenedentota bacterium]